LIAWSVHALTACDSDAQAHCPHTPARSSPLAAAPQNISDEDVLALVSDEVHQPQVVWALEDLQVGGVCFWEGEGGVRELGPGASASLC
jgi:hypothetical protein